MLSYTSRNQQLDTISQCLFTSPSQLLMIAGFKKSFSLLLPIFYEGYFPFFTLVALADFSLVSGEHSLEHHPTDATSEWRTIFDAKISPPTSRTTSPEVDLKECWSNVASK
ncbi:hypothetical protein ES319_A10G207800v1 [Gossypium barbadense]|nr:hypothetical protein ES319_A10G207800v1 [Gossypium barbadense]